MSNGSSVRLNSGGWYQRIPSNPLVAHHVLHAAAGVADSAALAPADEAIRFAWPLARPDSAVVAVAAEIHCQFHGRSLRAIHGYDQPSVIMEDIH